MEFFMRENSMLDSTEHEIFLSIYIYIYIYMRKNSMLDSTEHEIFPAQTCLNANYCCWSF